jgi:hypothetical protein
MGLRQPVTDCLPISEELIADRLACMLAHIRSGRSNQVLLHATLLANMLSDEHPHAQAIRDVLYEVLTLFVRGNTSLACQRLQRAIDRFVVNPRPPLPIGAAARRSKAARA